MFVLAHLCHVTPDAVDRMTIADFWVLVTACETVLRDTPKT